MFKHILVPTDGSKLSKKLVKEATKLASTLRAKITALHVVPSDFGIALDAQTEERLYKLALTDGERYLDDVEAAARVAGTPFERVLLRNDDPWKGIVNTARKKHCDLIMMTAHGRHGLSAFVLGSETNKVLVNSKIPVLVYR